MNVVIVLSQVKKDFTTESGEFEANKKMSSRQDFLSGFIVGNSVASFVTMREEKFFRVK